MGNIHDLSALVQQLALQHFSTSGVGIDGLVHHANSPGPLKREPAWF
jgi:hypothetical protein